MKDIQINGLSKKQCKLLDKMWSIKSIEDLQEWMGSLSVTELSMVVVLQELIVLQYTDEIDDISIAKKYLRKFRL
jgi:hypothetical protein